MNSQKFKLKSDVLICFENDENELIGSVPFCEQYIHFIEGTDPSDSIFNYISYKPQINVYSPLYKGENKSYFRFKLKIKNLGNTPIENPKIIIQANGNYEKIGDENIDCVIITPNAQTDIEINKSQGNFFINPHRNVFALEEEYITNIICIKPKIEGSVIELSWKLISNSFKKEGILKIKIETYLIRKYLNKYVEFRQHVRVEKNIEDYFEENE